MKDSYDCVIIGGGPAGMAAAARLAALGLGDVLLVERAHRLGGILNQCVHSGFGLGYFGEDLTGPEYARRLEGRFAASGAELALGAAVVEVTRSRIVKLLSREHGYREISARAVIGAMGCRERTRDNLEVAGTRPAGVFTAGQAQNLVNLRGYGIGHRVLVQGSGDIGLIMARRLAIEGYEIAGVIERLPYLSGLARNKVQCLDHFGTPLSFLTQVREVVGRKRVEGAIVESLDEGLRPIPGSARLVECDTILFSVGLIPEVDILKGAGILPAEGGSVAVNSEYEAEGSGIFVCGNALHIHDLADNASAEGEAAASRVEAFLRRPSEYRRAATGARPYSIRKVDGSRDEEFFRRLEREGAAVCIVCPRSCVVSARGATCERGAAYFAESRVRRSQVLTTTARLAGGGRVSLRSIGPVDVADIPRARAAAEASAPGGHFDAAGGGAPFSVAVDGREYRFSVSTIA